MIFLWLFCAIFMGVVFFEWFRQMAAEKVDCPVCGKRFPLVGGSYRCTKCRSRIVKTEDGEIKAVN